MQGRCPGAFIACNPEASPDNIVCVSGRNAMENCPILDFEIRKKTDVPQWCQENAGDGLSKTVNRRLQIDGDDNTGIPSGEAVDVETAEAACERIDDFSSNWTSVELNDELVIRYTKQGDGLPLTTFRLESDQPCMDSGTQISSPKFSLELQGTASCSEVEETGLKKDPRYKEHSMYDTSRNG